MVVGGLGDPDDDCFAVLLRSDAGGLYIFVASIALEAPDLLIVGASIWILVRGLLRIAASPVCHYTVSSSSLQGRLHHVSK